MAKREPSERTKGNPDSRKRASIERLWGAGSERVRPIPWPPGRWVPAFRHLFELFGVAMLRSEEQRALAIFELDREGGAPFAQYQIEPCGLLLDLPASSVDGEARERLLAAGLGLRRAAEVPDLRPSDEDVLDFDPLRKEYRWSEEALAAEELASLLFDHFGAPLAGPVHLTWWAEGGAPRQEVVLIDGSAEEPTVQ